MSLRSHSESRVPFETCNTGVEFVIAIAHDTKPVFERPKHVVLELPRENVEVSDDLVFERVKLGIERGFESLDVAAELRPEFVEVGFCSRCLRILHHKSGGKWDRKNRGVCTEAQTVTAPSPTRCHALIMSDIRHGLITWKAERRPRKNDGTKRVRSEVKETPLAGLLFDQSVLATSRFSRESERSVAP